LIGPSTIASITSGTSVLAPTPIRAATNMIVIWRDQGLA